MAKFEEFAGKLLQLEGGYVNHPLDKGGPTKYGVILLVWKQYGHDKDGDGDIDAEDIKKLSEDDARYIAKKIFWDFFNADLILNSSVAEFIVDWGYNSGRSTVAKIVQRLVKVNADGIVGANTVTAINIADQQTLFETLKSERKAFLDNIIKRKPDQAVFYKGWMNRVNSFVFVPTNTKGTKGKTGTSNSSSTSTTTSNENFMLARIKKILKESDFELYTKPYQLNIIGLRSQSVESNTFDDEIHVFYALPDGKWNYHVYVATTDPGTFWLNNPLYPQGTAILEQGQYVDAYAIGLHKGKYEALVQQKPVTVIRDYNRDAILDFNNGKTQKGLFGINIHRADSQGSTAFINKYSAGCQVFKDAGQFNEFMKLCKEHAKRYGNTFTYTLIDFRSLRRSTLKQVVAATTVIAALALGWLLRPNF